MSETRHSPASVQSLVQDEKLIRFRACEYLAGLSKELSAVAFKNGLDSLAIIFELARQDAERFLNCSDEHLNRS
jgi:hypothetical protein